MISEKAVVLTGGTGKVGRRLTTLLAKTAIPTFQASRSGETTTEPDASNVKTVTFDWNCESTWTTALAESQPHSVRLVARQFLDMLPPMKSFIDLAVSMVDLRRIMDKSSNPYMESPRLRSWSILQCAGGLVSMCSFRSSSQGGFAMQRHDPVQISSS